MKRRSFFASLAALVAAPFTVKAKPISPGYDPRFDNTYFRTEGELTAIRMAFVHMKKWEAEVIRCQIIDIPRGMEFTCRLST